MKIEDFVQFFYDLGLHKVIMFSAGLTLGTAVLKLINSSFKEKHPTYEHYEIEWTGYAHVPKRRKPSRKQRWMMMHRGR